MRRRPMRFGLAAAALIGVPFVTAVPAAEGPATNPVAGAPATRPAAHPTVGVIERFLAAVDAGDFERARACCIPDGPFPDKRLREMKDAFRLDRSTVRGARATRDRAAAVTDETPSRLADRLGTRWGLYLTLHEGRWLVSELDLVLDARAADRYLDEFQAGEPGAQKVMPAE